MALGSSGRLWAAPNQQQANQENPKQRKVARESRAPNSYATLARIISLFLSPFREARRRSRRRGRRRRVWPDNIGELIANCQLQ